MAQLVLPFASKEEVKCAHGAACSLNSVLPKPMQEACKNAEFLSDYLHWVPMDEVGVPDYYPKLSRDMSDMERRNLVYAIKEGLYVHIYPDDKGERDKYIPIEPHLTIDLSAILLQMETRLLDFVEKIGAAHIYPTMEKAMCAIHEGTHRDAAEEACPLTSACQLL